MECSSAEQFISKLWIQLGNQSILWYLQIFFEVMLAKLTSLHTNQCHHHNGSESYLTL